MEKKSTEYKESLYQWVWQHLEFNCQNLTTVCGKDVQITAPGELNHGGGPDFLAAKITIGGLQWNGAVEIHRTASEWFRHKHQHDEAYNNVFLHVVFSDESLTDVITQNGAKPYTLCLKPHLKRGLHQLAELKQEGSLLCRGDTAFINQKAFEEQVEKAHREYLNYKLEELLAGYPAGVPVSKAWKACFIARLYYTLGIPLNREPMLELAGAMAEKDTGTLSYARFLELAKRVAFSGRRSFDWVHTGMRPASRPEIRIRQAASVHFAVQQTPFKWFIDPGKNAWAGMVKHIPPGNRPGAQMKNILRQTVYVPARYLLGELLHSRALMEHSFNEWQSGQKSIPPEIIRPFETAGFSVNGPLKKLGLAHQYKRYCKERNCHHCKVFKNAIGS